MICSPRSLGRRRGKVGIRVVGVGLIVFGVGVVLVLLLRVLLLGDPRRTLIRRHPVIEGDVLLRGLVG